MNRSSNTIVVRKSTLLALLGFIVLIPLSFVFGLSSDASAKTIIQQDATPNATPVPPEACVDDPTSSACLILCASNPLQDFCLSAANTCAKDSSQPYCNDLCTQNPNREFCFDACTNDSEAAYCQKLCTADSDQKFCKTICNSLSANEQKPTFCAEMDCAEKPYLNECNDLCKENPNLAFCVDICTVADNPGGRNSPFCEDLCLANPNLSFCDTMCDVSGAVDIDYCIQACQDDPTRDYCKNICDSTTAQIQGLSFCLDNCTRIGTANSIYEGNNKELAQDLYEENQYCESNCYYDPSQPYCVHLCETMDYGLNFCSHIPCTAENVNKLDHCQEMCNADPTSALCQQACTINSNSYHCFISCQIDPTLPLCQEKCNYISDSNQIGMSSVMCNDQCWINPDLDYCQKYCELHPQKEFCENTCVADPSQPYCMELCATHPEMNFCAGLCEGNDSSTCQKVNCFNDTSDKDNAVCADLCETTRSKYSFCNALCENDEYSDNYFCISSCNRDPSQSFCADTCMSDSIYLWYCSDICENAEDPTKIPHCQKTCSEFPYQSFCTDFCSANMLSADQCVKSCAKNPGHPYCQNLCSQDSSLSFCEETCLRNPQLQYCIDQCADDEDEENRKIYAHCYGMCETASGDYKYKGIPADERFVETDETKGCSFLCDQAIIKATNELELNPPAQAGYRNEPVSPIPSFCEDQCNDVYTTANEYLGVQREEFGPWCNDLCGLRNDGHNPDYCYTRCDEENSALDFCDDVCFDITNPEAETFCTEVCLYKLSIEGVVAASTKIPIAGDFVNYLVNESGYESYTVLPYCTLLQDLPDGPLLLPSTYKQSHEGWTPYIDNRNPCAYHQAESPYCAYQCRYIDDTVPGCKSCDFNSDMPVCTTKCSQASDPNQLGYCATLCADNPNQAFCSTMCTNTDDPGKLSFCNTLCTSNPDQAFCGGLCEKSTNPASISFCVNQCAQGDETSPEYCKLMYCLADENSSDCSIELCQTVSDPEKVPYCLNYCKTDTENTAFCDDICNQTDMHYAYCAKRVDCTVDPYQDKCQTECDEASDPSKYSWCNLLCKQNYVNHNSADVPDQIPFCEKICDITQNENLSFCPVVCKDQPDSPYCTDLCRMNPTLSFCSDLCDMNSGQEFCTKLCDTGTAYNFCNQVCLNRPGLDSCFSMCEIDSALSFCPASCGIDTNFQFCGDLCQSAPLYPHCQLGCEETYGYFDEPYDYYNKKDFIFVSANCQDLCTLDNNPNINPMSDMCTELNHCDNLDFIPSKQEFSGYSPNCFDMCVIDPTMEYCGDICESMPTKPWCADNCTSNARLPYCDAVCATAENPQDLTFCLNACSPYSQKDFCPDICQKTDQPWDISVCQNLCKTSPNKYGFCRDMCNSADKPQNVPFCWDILIDNSQEPYGIEMCQNGLTSKTQPICKDVCMSNQETLSGLCETNTDPASDFCCADLCALPEYQSMDYCGDICAQNSNHVFCANRCTEGLDQDQPYCSTICKKDTATPYCAEFCDISTFLTEADQRAFCLAQPDSPCCHRLCLANQDNPPAYCESVCDYSYNVDYCQSYCMVDPDRPYCYNHCTEDPHLPYCASLCARGLAESFCTTLCEEDYEQPFCDRCWPGTYAPGEVAGCAENEEAYCTDNHFWTCKEEPTDACCEDTPGDITPPEFK
jgi:hypothetical protein